MSLPTDPLIDPRTADSGPRPGAKPVIGLAGAVGAGKSTVAAEFARLGATVINSDKLNHEVLQQPDVLTQLSAWWGDEVRTADGGPNRRKIAEIVFDSPADRQRLESLVFPLIAQRRQDMIRSENEKSAVKAIILDSPLLFESNLDRLCDSVVFVETSPTKRLQRVQRARNWDGAELRRRERWQASPDLKKARSGFVITNDGEPEDLRQQVNRVWEAILTRSKRP